MSLKFTVKAFMASFSCGLWILWANNRQATKCPSNSWLTCSQNPLMNSIRFASGKNGSVARAKNLN